MNSENATDVSVGADDELLWRIAAASPENPFRTLAYVRARASEGARPLGFFWMSGRAGGCVGFLKRGRAARTLEIPSAPEVNAQHAVWGAIREACRRHHVTKLSLQTYGAIGATVPELDGAAVRRNRREFVLPLGEHCPPLMLSRNHRRNEMKARSHGIVVRKSDDHVSGTRSHGALLDASMARRLARGESAAQSAESRAFLSLLEHGAAELYQAHGCGGTTLSSILVLVSSRGAYYHSAGTNPEGMRVGASPLLVCELAQILRDRGVTLFNLGGASVDEEGLSRFKAGFGSTMVESCAVTADLAKGVRRLVLSMRKSSQNPSRNS